MSPEQILRRGYQRLYGNSVLAVDTPSYTVTYGVSGLTTNPLWSNNTDGLGAVSTGKLDEVFGLSIGDGKHSEMAFQVGCVDHAVPSSANAEVTPDVDISDWVLLDKPVDEKDPKKMMNFQSLRNETKPTHEVDKASSA